MKPVKYMITKIKESLKIGDKKITSKLNKLDENLDLIKKFKCIKEIVNN